MNEQQRLDIATAFIRALESKAKHESMADKIDEPTLENAYRVQDAFIEIMTERGEEIVGWKVALTSKAMRSFVVSITHFRVQSSKAKSTLPLTAWT